ncbi:hypothetical protein W02_30910 [Nitrospira sp. KM1]|uniref:hypothetical protein n=1 Tax=Nitrospira sp. KM1 TaxID=1936990 RepID=UPI0013A79CD5|nr:hypothetical protein [Nitrospira sp. KM1]BCA55951.1 hypothetical protein W02_30910 [Nitrospira sp. KM1]
MNVNSAVEEIATVNKVSIKDVRDVITTHFPDLWQAVEMGLSTCATLLLADNVNPVALIYVGPPSAGKTTVASMFDGACMNGDPICYRSDKFTHAAFVSQSANTSVDKLKKVDLLPKIQKRVLLTPEMATIFKGKQDELIEKFSVITRVLDGQGFMTDSGTHGRRGYEGDYLFAWLGCTTPFDSVVWKVMANLGSRMFFLVMQAMSEPTVEELSKINHGELPYVEKLRTCRLQVHQFLAQVFTDNKGFRGVPWELAKDPAETRRSIAACAKLLAIMRTPYDPDIQPQHEAPYRAQAVLYNLARGHALLHERRQLTVEDMPHVVQVALSSMPEKRRKILLAFKRNGGEALTVNQVKDALRVSPDTAKLAMQEMAWLGFALYEDYGNGVPHQLVVNPEWAWSMKDEFIHL